MSNKNKKNQQMTKEQREAKIEAAKQKQQEALRKQMMRERMKKIGVVVLCIVLVVALGIPTVALSLLGAGA